MDSRTSLQASPEPALLIVATEEENFKALLDAALERNYRYVERSIISVIGRMERAGLQAASRLEGEEARTISENLIGSLNWSNLITYTQAELVGVDGKKLVQLQHDREVLPASLYLKVPQTTDSLLQEHTKNILVNHRIHEKRWSELGVAPPHDSRIMHFGMHNPANATTGIGVLGPSWTGAPTIFRYSEISIRINKIGDIMLKAWPAAAASVAVGAATTGSPATGVVWGAITSLVSAMLAAVNELFKAQGIGQTDRETLATIICLETVFGRPPSEASIIAETCLKKVAVKGKSKARKKSVMIDQADVTRSLNDLDAKDIIEQAEVKVNPPNDLTITEEQWFKEQAAKRNIPENVLRTGSWQTIDMWLVLRKKK